MTTEQVHDALAAAYAGRAVRARPAAGQQPRTSATAGSNAAQLQAVVDLDSGRIVVTERDRQPRQGRGRPGGAERQPDARPAGDGRPHRGRGRAVSVTAAAGFRACRRRRRPSRPSGGLDLALVVNDGPSDVAAGVFTSNRVQAAPVLWTQQVLADASRPRGRPQLRRRERVHRTGRLRRHPPHRRGGRGRARHRRRRGRGLLDRPDRRAAADARGPRRRRRRRPARCRNSAAATPPRPSARPTPSPSRRSPPGTAGRSAAWPRAPACSRPAWRRCSASSRRTPTSTRRAPTPRCVRRPARPSTGSTRTAACPPTTRCCCWSAARPGPLRTPTEFARGRPAVCADLAAQLIADAEGATKEVRVEVVGAATEDDAVEVGRSIARNNLLKCALFGNDPNWGRVLAAIGTTIRGLRAGPARRGHQRRPGLPRRRRGRGPQPRSTSPAATSTSCADLHAGDATATIWTNDLSHAYVEENSAYSS